MIVLGINGLSRGDLLEGVMQDPTLVSLVPFHLGAFDRDPDGALLRWFQDWMGVDESFLPL
jgi:hypothetical protein